MFSDKVKSILNIFKTLSDTEKEYVKTCINQPEQTKDEDIDFTSIFELSWF